MGNRCGARGGGGGRGLVSAGARAAAAGGPACSGGPAGALRQAGVVTGGWAASPAGADPAAARGQLTGVPAARGRGSSGRLDPGGPGGLRGWMLRAGKAVAFVTYSSVFNANPYITAHTLVLDDAHAAEGF